MQPSNKDTIFLMTFMPLMVLLISIFVAKPNARVSQTPLGLHRLPAKQKELSSLWSTDIMENLCLLEMIQ